MVMIKRLPQRCTLLVKLKWNLSLLKNCMRRLCNLKKRLPLQKHGLTLAAEKRLTAKGMSLKFVMPLVKDGKSIAQIDKHEVAQLSDVWANVVVLYVVDQTPSIGTIIQYISLEWNNVSKTKVFLHEDGCILVKFENMKDRNEIFYVGPFTLNNRPLIVKPQTPSFNFHDEIMRVIPSWVRFPNLPLNCRGPETLSRISSMIKVSLFADECITRQMRVSFARVLIEVYVTKEVLKVVCIEDTNGNLSLIHI